MLDEAEWVEIFSGDGLPSRVQHIRESSGVSLKEAQNLAECAVLDDYERITGFRESNVNALYHHRISLYGPPCHSCGKPLRTRKASSCVECGADR